MGVIMQDKLKAQWQNTKDLILIFLQHVAKMWLAMLNGKKQIPKSDKFKRVVASITAWMNGSGFHNRIDRK